MVEDRQEGARAEAERPVIAVEVEGAKVVRAWIYFKCQGTLLID